MKNDVNKKLKRQMQVSLIVYAVLLIAGSVAIAILMQPDAQDKERMQQIKLFIILWSLVLTIAAWLICRQILKKHWK